MKLFEEYSDIIDSDISLRIKKVKIMLKTNNVEEIQDLLDDDGITKKNLLDKEPFLYFDVMDILGKSNEASKKLDEMLNNALRRRDIRELIELGILFNRLGRAGDFKNKISGHPDADDILREIKFRGRRKQDFF